ncbi:MAG: hypothetical protein NVS4B6_13630 [Mycobacterium sp.]
MIQVAEEFVEAVRGGQKFIAVAEVILAELAGRVALRLQRRRDGRVFGLQSERRAGQAHFGQTAAVGVLAGDERRPARGATLLAVVVGEPRPLGCNPVDVAGPVPHHPVAVAAEVALTDVIAPDDQNVWIVTH